MNYSLEEFVENPELLLDLLVKVIDDYLEKSNQTQAKNKANEQLMEISRAIYRLEKNGISIPDSLRSEKVKPLTSLKEVDFKQRLSFILNKLIEVIENIAKSDKPQTSQNQSKNQLHAKRSIQNKPQRHNLKEILDCLERILVIDALVVSKWNQTHAAEELGLSRQGLINKMQRFEIYNND